MASTVSLNDVYPNSRLTPKNSQPTATTAASGKLPDAAPAAPVISWLGIVLLLVALRVVYELAPEG